MRAKEFTSYNPPELNVGDKILKGKFKNSPAEIKGFKKDKHNQPVLKTNKGDVQLFKPRVVKLMPEGIDLYKLHSDPKGLSQKGVNMQSVKINDAHNHIIYAEFVDGTPMSPQQLALLEKDFPELTGVNWKSVTLDNVYSWDAPDFVDAFISYAEFNDGTPLTDEQMMILQDKNPDKVNALAHETLY